MAKSKAKKNDTDVEAYLNTIEPEKKRDDSFAVMRLMEEVTGEPASMWGEKVVGFGDYQCTYADGSKGDWMLTGFAPRQSTLTLYIFSDFDEHSHLMDKLGRYRIGKSCLYIRKIDDIDTEVLRQLVAESVEHLKSRN